jgi:hypothetical protein
MRMQDVSALGVPPGFLFSGQNLPKIGIDLGDTTFNRKAPRLTLGKGTVAVPCEGAVEVITELEREGYEFVVVSKIDHGQEARVALSLFNCGLVPHVIDPEGVRFVYSRADKGPVLKELGIQIHIDDRIEVLNTAHEHGVACKILFVGVRDERTEERYPEINFEGVEIASTWEEVRRIIKGFSVQSQK